MWPKRNALVFLKKMQYCKWMADCYLQSTWSRYILVVDDVSWCPTSLTPLTIASFHVGRLDRNYTKEARDPKQEAILNVLFHMEKTSQLAKNYTEL